MGAVEREHLKPEAEQAVPERPRRAPELYVAYLDRELNVMAALSAFCALAAGLVLEKVIGAEANTHMAKLWSRGWGGILAGSTALFAAGGVFFVQRSKILQAVANIALAFDDPRDCTREINKIERKTAPWIYYRWGIGLMAAGVFCYLGVLGWLGAKP